MSDTPPPVLILAARESGGSLLSSLLGMHPGFCGAPHLNVLAFEAFWQLAQYARIPRDSHMHGLLRFLGQELMAEQTVQSVQAALRWLGRNARDDSAAELHARLRGLVAPRRLVDYSPLVSQNEAAMRRAVEALPDAHVIHLTRDPLSQGRAVSLPVWQSITLSLDFWDRRGRLQPCMDVFEIGEQLIDWSCQPPVFDPQYAWYRTNDAARRVLADLPAERVTRVELEALVERPGEVLTGLLTRLGADADAATVQAMLTGGLSGYAAPGPYTAPFGTDFEIVGLTVGDALRRAADRRSPGRADRPLPWRGDGDTLLPKVAGLARDLGYPLAMPAE